MRSSWTLFLLIFFFATALQFFLPWWSLAAAALLLAALLGRSAGRSFLAGFGGVGLGWLLLAVYYHLRTAGLLSNRVAELLPLGGNGWLVAVVGAVLAGLVGGVAALTGYWLRQAARPASVQRAV